MNSFIGRDEEVAGIAELLEHARLITLCGAPGVGKSRLALEVVAHLAVRYSDGAAFVELASLSDGSRVPSAVASAMSLPEVPGESLTASLLARLRGRRFLLVLDNCEHLLGACAELASTLLGECPDLRVLATSREALRTNGESPWPVPPLRVPEPAVTDPVALMEYAAVRLFIEQAEAAQPGFAFSPYVAPAVAGICRRLDGIPLAIKLAAARAESLTSSEIERRLDDRFHLLGDGRTSEPPRHRTLQSALDWSHDLLSPPERQLFRRLTVFAGSFDVDAAAEICRGGEVQEERVPTLLDGLVAKSLIVLDPVSGRRHLPQTIRAYARERVEQAGEAASVREAHARFYLGLAEEADPELTGASQALWLERLEDNRADLRAALEWTLGQGRSEWALRLAGALILFWRVRCHFSEGRELLGAAVAARSGPSPELRAKALWGSGFMTLMTGDAQGAMPHLEESLAAYRALGDTRGTARALLILGNAGGVLEDPRALTLLEESSALAREARDAWCLAHALSVAAQVHCAGERHSRARALFEESIKVARDADDLQGLRFGLLGLGELLGRRGEFAAAAPVLEESVAVMERLGEVYCRAAALTSLGQLAFGCGEFARARETLDAALAIARGLGRPEDRMVPLIGLARVALAEDDLPRARGYVEEVLDLARGSGRVLFHRQAAEISGEVAACDGDVPFARRCFEEALDLARAEENAHGTAQALLNLGQLARAERDGEQAAKLYVEALRLLRALGDIRGITATLEGIGGLAGEAGSFEEAACVLGAAEGLYESNGYARSPWEARSSQRDLALVHRSLPPEDFEAAWARGRRLSIQEAVTHASRVAGRARVEDNGWSSLTGVERQVAALVAEHMTNAEIGERLFLAAGTVKNHLSLIFSKLGISRRRELAREFRRHV